MRSARVWAALVIIGSLVIVGCSTAGLADRQIGVSGSSSVAPHAGEATTATASSAAASSTVWASPAPTSPGESTTTRMSATVPPAQEDADGQVHGNGHDCPDQRCLSIVVTGDVLLHPPLVDQARADSPGGQGLDFAPMLAAETPYVQGADLGICHLETPLAPAGRPVLRIPGVLRPTAGAARAGRHRVRRVQHRQQPHPGPGHRRGEPHPGRPGRRRPGPRRLLPHRAGRRHPHHHRPPRTAGSGSSPSPTGFNDGPPGPAVAGQHPGHRRDPGQGPRRPRRRRRPGRRRRARRHRVRHRTQHRPTARRARPCSPARTSTWSTGTTRTSCSPCRRSTGNG